MSNGSQEFNYEEIEYLQHGDRSMMLYLGRSASASFAAAALDFWHGSDKYPTAPQDTHYATRWLKLNTELYNLDAEGLGLCGQFSGGHLAAITAMRPNDDCYGAVALGSPAGIDAQVHCAVLVWLVINTRSWNRHAHRSLETQNNAGWAG